jgi:hypothetical protein
MATWKMNLVLSEREARALSAILTERANEANTQDEAGAIAKTLKTLSHHINARPDTEKRGDMWKNLDSDGNHKPGSPAFVDRIDRTSEGDVLYFVSGLSGTAYSLESLGWRRHRRR